MIKPHIIRAAFILGPKILLARLTWMRKYSHNPNKYPIEVRYKKVRQLIIKILDTLKLDIKAINLDYLNKHEGSYLGLSNHRHAFDPLLYIYLSEKPISFLAKKEAFKMPFVKQIMKSIDAFSIDREDILHQLKLFKDIASRLEKNDLSYFIFPEGTRQKNLSLVSTLPYKDGAIKPAYWAKKDIIFVSMYGSEVITKKKVDGFKKRNITFYVNEPIKFKSIENKPTTEVMPRIEKLSNKNLITSHQENISRNLK